MEQVVVISGLAQGIGREVAKLLAVAGHSVAGFDMDADGIAGLTDELSGSRGNYYLIAMDITDRKGILQFRDLAGR